MDKHKPMKMEDLCGNGDKVKQLKTWLSCWGKPAEAWGASSGGGGKPKDDGRDKKAALLTGPPGEEGSGSGIAKERMQTGERLTRRRPQGSERRRLRG